MLELIFFSIGGQCVSNQDAIAIVNGQYEIGLHESIYVEEVKSLRLQINTLCEKVVNPKMKVVNPYVGAPKVHRLRQNSLNELIENAELEQLDRMFLIEVGTQNSNNLNYDYQDFTFIERLINIDD